MTSQGAPAAFGRLCVETRDWRRVSIRRRPAAFGRLCVETRGQAARYGAWMPAAFGRLCVETLGMVKPITLAVPAAFGRLCVETANREMPRRELTQPPSGGCVLKLPKNSGNKKISSSRLRAAVC